MPLKKIYHSDLKLLGFPEAHSTAFGTIAENTKCVISSRTPGVVCEMLLRKGYDAKSFFIKSKSCNWGPMAGFLCLDPMMNKKLMEGALSNLKETLHSLRDLYDDSMTENAKKPDLRSSESVQIMFDDDRLEWLKKNLKDGKFEHLSDSVVTYTDPKSKLSVVLLKTEVGSQKLWSLYYDIMGFYGIEAPSAASDTASDEGGPSLTDMVCEAFVAKADRDPDSGKAQKQLADIHAFWALVKERKYLIPQNDKLKSIGKVAYAHYVPLMGLTNPRQTYAGPQSYLNAVTGDYDLYAVWPAIPTEEDRRVMAMKHSTSDKDITNAEDNNKIGKAVGNITERIFMTAQLLNSVMADPYKPSPNRVFHSDECGRPFVSNADEAVFFLPNGDIFRVEGGLDLASVIEHCHGLGFTCYVNKGWETELLDANPELVNKIAWSNSI